MISHKCMARQILISLVSVPVITVTSSTKINVKKRRKITHKNKISNYLTPNREMKNRIPSRKWTYTPGDLGTFSEITVIRCETFEKNIFS